MRNLKRVLSLALACVMVIGMMVMTTGAADFGDAAEIEYTEAVEVMVALGVLEGDDLGNYNPTDILTREQAAKIIAYMLLGERNAEKLNANNTVFTDVAAGRWSAGYISYCTTLGILAGNGDGTFNPTGELTGVAFGKMLLTALGYDAKIEGYVNNKDWATNIATDIIGAGIDVKGVTMAAPLTREQAAQMAFQTLTADMVGYSNKGWEMTLSDGQTIIMGASPAEALKHADFPQYASVYGGNKSQTLQFSEKYFEDLSKDGSTPDDFGNPAYTWMLDNDPIVTVESKPVATFTKATNPVAIAKALKGYVFVDDNGTNNDDSDDTVYKINNVEAPGNGTPLTNAGDTILAQTTYNGTRTNTNVVMNGGWTVAKELSDLTANGKVVKFYANMDKEITQITTVSYDVARVSKISENKDGDISYTLQGVDTLVDYADEEKIDNLVIDGELKVNDQAIFCKETQNGVTTWYVYAAGKFTGTQSAFNEGEDTITVDGVTYDVATDMNSVDLYIDGLGNLVNDFPNSGDEANFYTDAYGNVVVSTAIDKVQYAVINKIAKVAGLTDSIQAELAFADGTTKVVTVGKLVNEAGTDVDLTTLTTDSTNATYNTIHANIVYNYEVKGDKYFLTAIENGSGSAAKQTLTATAALEMGNPVVGSITTDDNTVFVVHSGTGANEKYTVYTGYKTIPNVAAAVGNEVYVDYAVARGSVAFVYVDATGAVSVDSDSSMQDMVYITSDDVTTVRVSQTTTVYKYDAVINGEKGTLTAIGAGNGTLAEGLYKVTTIDKDGYASALVAQSAGNGVSGDDYKLYASLTAANCTDAKNGVIKINSTTYTYDGSETVYLIDKKGDVSETTVSALDFNTNTADYARVYVKEVLNNNTTPNIHEIDTMYVVLP